MGQPTRCPKCGGSVQGGYGLCGGGIGFYWYCESDACDYFDKTQDEQDEEESK